MKSVKSMTFISIIIPFNKGERYLKDCLDSLAEQNLHDSEVILILNGVKEDLTELLKEFSSKLNLIINEFPNELTVGKARNIGIEMATGEYIYFIDSDDYIYENALDKLAEAARRTNADLINGERIRTSFIRERFTEELEKPHVNPLKGSETSKLFFIRLLIGKQSHSFEFISSLHSLIKKDILTDIRFDESKRYLVDYGFMLEVLDNINSFTSVNNAIYAKRTRDDPVYLTSLNQEIEKNDFSLFLKEYPHFKGVLDNKSDEKFDILKSELLTKLHYFHYHVYTMLYVRDIDDRWRNDYLDDMAVISCDFKPEDISIKDKFEIKALQNKNWSKYDKLVKVRWGFVKLKQMKDEHWRFNTALYDNHYIKRPIKKNKLVFESFYGRYYSDSPKYIYEYLLKNHADEFDMVWVINDNDMEIPGNPKKVKQFSIDYYKQIGEAEYYIFNTRHPARLRKKDGQKFICTWHGTPLKRLGFDIGNLYINNPDVKHAYKRDSLLWDYMISPNRYTTEILRSAFAYEGEIIESGYPRNDILYNAKPDDIIRIKDALNLPKDKKVILYAPTWRDDEQFDVATVNFTLELDLKKLQEELSDEYVILLRMHYFVANNIDISDFKGFAYDASGYGDIAELYLISDLLITDYSSVFFDYANLKRPILFFTYDLEKYENVLRGFYIDIHTEIPGPLLKTNDELLDAVQNIDKVYEEFAKKYDEFYERFCSIDDGNASKRIYERIWK